MFPNFDPYDKIMELEQKLDLAYDTLKELSRVNQELAVFSTQVSANIQILNHKTQHIMNRLQRLEKETKDGKTKTSTTTNTAG